MQSDSNFYLRAVQSRFAKLEPRVAAHQDQARLEAKGILGDCGPRFRADQADARGSTRPQPMLGQIFVHRSFDQRQVSNNHYHLDFQ